MWVSSRPLLVLFTDFRFDIVSCELLEPDAETEQKALKARIFLYGANFNLCNTLHTSDPVTTVAYCIYTQKVLLKPSTAILLLYNTTDS